MGINQVSFTQDAIQKFIPEIELSMKSRNVITHFSYTSNDVEINESDLDREYGTSNVIERISLKDNKWAVKTISRDTNPSYAVGGNARATGLLTDFGSCNVGINLFSKTFATPGHDGVKAFKQQVADVVSQSMQEAQNHIVPRINYEFLRAMCRGASDVLFMDSFKNGNPLIAGQPNVNRTPLNLGWVSEDRVTLFSTPPPKTVIDDVAWNNSAGGQLSGVVNGMYPLTYKGLLAIKSALIKSRIREIKGKKYQYVLYMSVNTATSILNSIYNFQTQVSLQPDEIRMFGWTSFIVSEMLIVGMPLIDQVYVSDGTGTPFNSSSTSIDFGNTVAANFSIDIDNAVIPYPDLGLRPIIACGEGAALTGIDWNMNILENEAIAYKDATGREFSIENDIGFTRKEFIVLPRFNNTSGISSAQATYGNMINQNSMIFVERDPS